MIDFPNSPTLGQQFAAAGVTWTWDGAKWLPSGLAPTIVPGINDNRIINGDMRIDQRNAGANGTAQGYTLDRWQYATTQVGKFTWGQNPTVPPGFGYSFGIGAGASYPPLTTDYFVLGQPIEADMVSDFAWGTANAQPVTLSFWAYSPLAGTFSGSIRNAPNNRSYPFTYTLVASTWAKIAVTIPGDTGGTWVMKGNMVSVVVGFDLGCGANFRGPANVWANANYIGTTGSVSIIAAGSAFYLTGVKLEVGSVATPYNRQSLAKSMADCQRYYQVGQIISSSYVGGAVSVFANTNLPVTMRSSPTMTVANTSTVNGTALAGGSYNGTSVYFSITASATGTTQIGCTYTASAEL